VTAPRSPVADLAAFHQQTLDRCEALWRLVVYLGQCPPDAQLRGASLQLMAWFDQVREGHVAEEQHLYPRLAASLSGLAAAELLEFTHALTRQHRALEALWDRLREIVAAVAAGECRPEVIDAAGEFIRLTRAQVQSERETVLPLAHELIQEAELAVIVDSVRARMPGAAHAAA
jgi:hypothetical protein